MNIMYRKKPYLNCHLIGLSATQPGTMLYTLDHRPRRIQAFHLDRDRISRCPNQQVMFLCRLVIRSLNYLELIPIVVHAT